LQLLKKQSTKAGFSKFVFFYWDVMLLWRVGGGGHRASGSGQLQGRKLEDSYFDNWPAGTELNRESFKQLMRIELRK
jgi:hypothetical protein